MTTNRPNVCVVGAGERGVDLACGFGRLKSLRLICDKDPGRLDVALGRNPQVDACYEYSAVLSSSDIDAVVLATPAEDHFWMAEAALRRGKDVLIENPVALGYDEGVHLISLAARMRRVLMMGYRLEYHPAIMKLSDLIQRGELGQLRYIYSTCFNVGTMGRAGRYIRHCAPEDLSTILSLVGDMPTEVAATGGAHLQTGVTDVTVTNLFFHDDVRTHVFVSWLHPYKEHRLMIVGSEKIAVFDDLEPSGRLSLFEQRLKWVGGKPMVAANAGVPVAVAVTDALRLECQHFLDCVRTRQNPRTGGAGALRVLRVLQAWQQSLQADGQPVQLATVRATEATSPKRRPAARRSARRSTLMLTAPAKIY